MSKGKWVKDSCPFAKDAGFDSVIGDVKPGETVFGFTFTRSGGGTTEKVTIKTATGGKVTEMFDTDYKVGITKVSADSVGAAATPCVYDQHKEYFYIVAEDGEEYDIVVNG